MIELPDPSSAPRVADWVELNLSVSQEPMSKAQVTAAIEALLGKEPSEAFISDVWNELEYRRSLYTNPTFTVLQHTIEPLPGIDHSPEYRACLILSLFGLEESAHDPGKLFERITRKAVQEYVSGEAVVFGWPFDPEDDAEPEETKLKRKIRQAAETLGERFIEAPPTQFNDRGLDVIGWMPFGDHRTGQVVILLQCTVQKNWKDKLPVPVENWQEYIHWSCNPIRAFAVPSIVAPRDWHERSKEKGIIFDRARIVNLITADPPDAILAGELNAWIGEQLAEN